MEDTWKDSGFIPSGWTIEVAGPAGSKGKATATIGGEDVDVKWVQLWADGPKFAEFNVGVTDGKAESFGGYYAWGGNQDKVDDHNEGTVELTGDNDTATKLWGSKWRMPTKKELKALATSTNCTGEWTTVGGVNGIKFTGLGDYSSNSIFLPVADATGDYWSSTPYPSDSDNAVQLHLVLGGIPNPMSDIAGAFRNNGFSVRAVLK